MADDAIECIREMADADDLEVSHRSLSSPGQYVHELGGARMGTDPAQSVLDRWNRCWDARSLYVVDGACFVTTGWQNPSLTMMALASRAAEHLVLASRGLSTASTANAVAAGAVPKVGGGPNTPVSPV